MGPGDVFCVCAAAAACATGGGVVLRQAAVWLRCGAWAALFGLASVIARGAGWLAAAVVGAASWAARLQDWCEIGWLLACAERKLYGNRKGG